MREFELKYSENGDDYSAAQKVWTSNPDEKVSFYVQNLNECPEDAIIGRDLFDAGDFIEAVKLGFRIAKRGYDKIVVNDVPWEERFD